MQLHYLISLQEKKLNGSDACDFLLGKLGEYGLNETSAWRVQNWAEEETFTKEESIIISQNEREIKWEFRGKSRQVYHNTSKIQETETSFFSWKIVGDIIVLKKSGNNEENVQFNKNGRN